MPYFEPSRPRPDCLTPPKGEMAVKTVLAKAEEHAKFEKRVMTRIKAGARIMDAVKAETGG